LNNAHYILGDTGPLSGTTHHLPSFLPSPNHSSGVPQTSFSSIDELGGPGPSLPNSTRKPVLQTALGSINHARPGLHARSITSPANQFAMSQPTSTAFSTVSAAPMRSQDDYADQYDEAILSDGENSPFPSLTINASGPGRGLSGPGPSEYQTTPTSATDGGGAFSLQGMRRGMRRLTGGKSESQKEKEKARDVTRLRGHSGSQNLIPGAIQSPRVPKVPVEYLNASASNINGPSPNTSPGL
jgi:hypothetical protein